MTITIKRPRSTVEFCTDLGLQADWEAANAALSAAKATPSGMMNDNTVKEAAAAVIALEQAMKDQVLLFDLQALPRKKWQEAEAAHPERDGVKADEVYSVHVATFFDAVIPDSIYAVRDKTTNQPVDFDPHAEWSALADEMTEGQYNTFALKVLRLNRGDAGVPFSQAASKLTGSSAKS